MMDYLQSLQQDQNKKTEIEQLLLKKQQLQQKLLSLSVPPNTQAEEAGSLASEEILQLKDLTDCYRLLGVSVHTEEPNLIVRFDPLWRDSYHSTQTCFLELIHVHGRDDSDRYEVGKTTVPAFIPINELEKTHLERGELREFIQEVSQYMHCYNCRREELLYVKRIYSDQLMCEIEVDLPISYISLHLRLDHSLPCMKINISYNNLQESRPSHVELHIDESPESSQIIQDETVQKWRKFLVTLPLSEALHNIMADVSKTNVASIL